jgi:replicative DNA helicase
VAEQTQTPPDLAAVLQLAGVRAGLARRVRVAVRPGWSEPLNPYVAVALLSGERKSSVFTACLSPLERYEADEQERQTPDIARAASAHRILDGKLKKAEAAAAKADNAQESLKHKREAAVLAEELAAHRVPPDPQFLVDDVTPEKLSQLLAEHMGRMFLAAAEGTIFDILKGRYNDGAPSFDVFLKASCGDALRVSRVGRGRETVLSPALTAAVCVRPTVIRGMAEHAAMVLRGSSRGGGTASRPAALAHARSARTRSVPRHPSATPQTCSASGTRPTRRRQTPPRW